MTRRGWTPGPVLHGLARLLVPARLRDEFLGDLIEEARKRSPVLGRFWFVAQLALSTPALVRYRLGRIAHRRTGGVVMGLVMALVWISADVMLAPRAFWVSMSLLVVLMNGLAAFFIRERTPFHLLAAVTLMTAVGGLVAAGFFLVLEPARVLASPVTWTIAATSFVLYLTVWLWSRWAHPAAWERWRQVTEQTGVLGFIAFRHIPRDLDRESAA